MQAGDPHQVADLDGSGNPLLGPARHHNALVDALHGILASAQFLFGTREEIFVRAGARTKGRAARLPAQLLHLLARFLQLGLHEVARLGDHRTPRLLDLGKLVAQVGLEQLALALACPGALGSLQRLLLGAANIVEQLVGLQCVGAHRRLRLLHDDRVHPQTPRDGQRVGTAGQTDAQFVGRAQRLDVELDRRVAHTRCVVSIELEIAVVRRRKGRDAAIAQVIQQRHGQRRAFLRIGARAQLVEQHQALRVGLLQDVDDVGHVAGEGAEALLDALLVADVGVDAFEDTQLAALVNREHHARLRHERQQADGLERDCLAARVGPRDHDEVGVVIEIDVNGHDRLLIEQRMTRPVQVDDRAGVRQLGTLVLAMLVRRFAWLERHHLGQRGIERVGILRLGKGKIQFRQDLRVAAQVDGLLGHARAQFE